MDPHYLLKGLLVIILPIFIGLIILEMVISKRRHLNLYLPQDTFANIAILLIRASLNLLLLGTLLFAILVSVSKFSLHLTDGLSPFWYWTLLIIGQDFLYYWFHRYSHLCRWGWASHIVHHSSNYINLVTAVRESVTYLFSGIWVFWLPLVIIGFQPQDVVVAIAINLAYQFILHTRLVGTLGWYEYLFNTPSHHRVHHARNPQYVNKNYAAIFIIWDRLFGTFAKEVETPDYGLVHQIYNYNPFYILVQGWYEILRDVIKERNLKYFLIFPKQ